LAHSLTLKGPTMTYTEDITIAVPRQRTLPATIAEKFVDFHTKSPEVYDALVRLAREWVFYTRRNRLGIKALFERARWEFALRTSDPDFKLCNSYTAYYARLIMAREPDLVGLFELRKSEADDFMESAEWQELVTAGEQL
jgi:hypothetical protein